MMVPTQFSRSDIITKRLAISGITVVNITVARGGDAIKTYYDI